VSAPGRSPLAPNIAANLGGQIAVLVLALFAARLVFSRLGEDALGLVLFVQTLNVVLALVLNLGVSAVTVREVAAHANDDPGYVRDLLRTAASLYWGAYAALAGLLVLTAPWIATHWVHLRTLDAGTASAVIRVLGVTALTALPRALYASIFRGMQRMVFNNVIEAGILLLQQLGTVVIVIRGGGLFSVVVWLAATYGMGIIAYWLMLSHVIPLRALVPGWSPVVVRRNARFSAHMMSISWLAAVHTYVDRLAVSRLLTVATFGWYAFAAMLVGRGTLVTMAISDAAYPSLSNLFTEGKRSAMLVQYRALQDLVCYTTLPLYAGIAYVTLPLMTVVFNHQVAATLLLPVAVLCLGYFMNGTLTMPYVYSLAVAKPQITSRLSFLAAFIVVPVAVVSVALFGVAGAGLGYLAYHVFFYAVGVPRYCHECLQLPASSWYRQVGVVLLIGAATYGTGFLVAWLAAGLSTAALILSFIVASLIFTLIAARLVDPGLREAAARFLRPMNGQKTSRTAA
jgi:O-antigen/teichoic acid export membrane protein